MKTLGLIALGIFLCWIYEHPVEFAQMVRKSGQAVEAGMEAASDEYQDKHKPEQPTQPLPPLIPAPAKATQEQLPSATSPPPSIPTTDAQDGGMLDPT